MKDCMRKFRVQFLETNGLTGQENCELCVKELNRFMEMNIHRTNEEARSNQNSLSHSLQMTDSLQPDSLSFIEPVGTSSMKRNLSENQDESKHKYSDYTLKELTTVSQFSVVWSNIINYYDIYTDHLPRGSGF